MDVTAPPPPVHADVTTSEVHADVATPPSARVDVGVDVGPPGPPGPAGPAGPSAVSADAGNTATLGTDSLIYVPASSGGGLDEATADARYVNVDGDEMSGDLHIVRAGADTRLKAKSTTDTSFVSICAPDGKQSGFALQTGDSTRWIFYRTGDAESGSNAGSNFGLARYADDGSFLGNVWFVSRQWGDVTLTAALFLQGDPDSPMKAATKQYVDARTPKILVLGPSDPVPGGTPAGTVILRTA